MIRRGMMFVCVAALMAGGAMAQPISSQPLGPPPGGADEGYQPYSQEPDQAPSSGNDPYADPEQGGAYDPYADPEQGGAYNPDAARSAPAPYRSAPQRTVPEGYSAPPRSAAPYDPYAPTQAPGEAPAPVATSCDTLLAALERYYGPPENPMKPRDEACAGARGANTGGGPNDAFRQCSDDFFKGYEAKRAEYRACMDRDVNKAQERLDQRRTTAEAARGGYTGTAPQATGPYARAGAPGWLGVQVAPVSPQSAYRLGVEGMDGALVQNAVQGSPAHKAGIRRGDVIIGVDGEPISRPQDLQYLAERIVAGQQVQLDVLRGGRRESFTVEIEARR